MLTVQVDPDRPVIEVLMELGFCLARGVRALWEHRSVRIGCAIGAFALVLDAQGTHQNARALLELLLNLWH